MPGRLAVALSVGMLVVLAAFGVLGTRDYLEHHRHRWSLLEELLAQQIPSQHINGGLEFGGMFNYGPRGRSSWWVRDEQYIVTYRENIPGYTVVASREYRRLLPPRLEKISVHQRSE